MKLTSRILLKAAKLSPYGHWKLVSIAANKDSSLWDFPISLKSIPGVTLRADLREQVYTQFLRHGCIPHQKPTDELLKKLIRRGDLIFDIGANIGYLSLLFNSLLRNSGTIVAIEPSTRCFYQLQRNTAFAEKIQTLNVAISNKTEKLRFAETKCLERSSLETVNTYAKTIDVEAIQLDDLCLEYGMPDFVKIDVEGHEFAVFQGAKKMLSSKLRPLIYFEALNSTALKKCIQIIETLSENSFKIYRSSKQVKLLPWQHPSGLNDYLAEPNEISYQIPPALQES
jgi:FkbM family methyltransferase